MSLVYFLTGLPALVRGQAPPISRETFIEKARDTLEGRARRDLDLALLRDEIDITTALRDRCGDHESGQARFDEERGTRKLAAERAERFLPEWVLQNVPHHILMRLWYQSIYRHARSPFLREWARSTLNMEEMIAARLCRMENMSHERFMVQMEGGFDSSWSVITRHYEDPDQAVANRVTCYRDIVAALEMEDFVAMERQLNQIRWMLIDRAPNQGLFSVDTVLAWYFRLRLLEREASWDRQRGEQVLEEMLDFELEGG